VDRNGARQKIRLPMHELAKNFDVMPGSKKQHRTTAAVYRDLKIFTQYQESILRISFGRKKFGLMF
jgi:hypothetical protein